VNVLLVVDVQRDFLPGGALAVPEGFEVLAPILDEAARLEGTVIATRDWHPPDHCSFAVNGGPWPVHCVAGTDGARLHTDVDRIADLVVSKGMTRDEEAYSGFDGTQLDAILRGIGAKRIVVCGLALDYCVRATCLDAVAALPGAQVELLAAGTAAIERGAETIAELASAGVAIRDEGSDGRRG
jgi:nicotinamidase/pyrazinamidase